MSDDRKLTPAEQIAADELAAYEHELRQHIKHGRADRADEVRAEIEGRGGTIPAELAAPKAKATKDAGKGGKADKS